jgi:hypothetical protein
MSRQCLGYFYGLLPDDVIKPLERNRGPSVVFD